MICIWIRMFYNSTIVGWIWNWNWQVVVQTRTGNNAKKYRKICMQYFCIISAVGLLRIPHFCRKKMHCWWRNEIAVFCGKCVTTRCAKASEGRLRYLGYTAQCMKHHEYNKLLEACSALHSWGCIFSDFRLLFLDWFSHFLLMRKFKISNEQKHDNQSVEI